MGEDGPPTPDCIYSSRPDLKNEANPRQYQIGLLQLIYAASRFSSPHRLGTHQTTALLVPPLEAGISTHGRRIQRGLKEDIFFSFPLNI
ncbi:Hypothetical predicted protein [Podarcis lilfordi]|uniref:Uncharacterized protein n=1 Tax=Podarcis lilfordi TaxID=74358 RepID=A0AA35LNA3_9SAUR|nr:Hypothetical predicted protein [Podarcis lilfordi]